ncbi:MAG: hypothetical protein KJ634_11045 [Gammaproteobacteria bacterium]|nr:hypothetical protein [Gammaproteobacteria bacterium]MBU1416149.1 hypothetical protein [Gammaproteobacteria bacterium]
MTMIAASVAHAEGPMATDDAGTLDKGGMKVEAVWAKDDEARGVEALFGFSVVENLEMEVAGAYAKDDAADPATKVRGIGFGAKWVPYRNETGWSLGARLDYGRNRIDDREADEKTTERELAVTALASYRLGNGQVLHINLGAAEVEAQGDSDTVGTWGVGYEFPLADRLQLTVEAFGEEHARPDKAIGLRYEVFDGFKVSAAVGRGNDRDFGQVGVAWEF